jgi:hypothetical protein
VPGDWLLGLVAIRNRATSLALQASMLVLPALWLFLVAQVFHNEALPGDRQFWLTRPYSRGSLFAAKALFVVTWILLPLAVAQGAILVLRGFPLLQALPGLVWTQVLIVAVGVLPATALATLTSTFTRFLIAALAAPFVVVAVNALGPWSTLNWVRVTVGLSGLVTVAGLVLVLQFTTRRTRMSALVAVVGVAMVVASLPFLPWETAAAVQTRFHGPVEGPLTADLERPEPKQPDHRNLISRRSQFFFRTTGPSPDQPVNCNGGELRILGHSGSSWTSGFVPPVPRATPDAPAGSCAFNLRIPGALFDPVINPTVDIDATLFVTVFGREQLTSLTAGRPAVIVPDVGRCAVTRPVVISSVNNVAYRTTRVACQMAFRAPPGPVVFTGDDGQTHSSRAYSYSPFPAELRILPVRAFGLTFDLTDVVTVGTRAPIAHVRTKVQARDVSLQDFEVRLGR